MVAATLVAAALLAAVAVNAQESQMYELRFTLPSTTVSCMPFDIRYQTLPNFDVTTFAPVTLNLYINTVDGVSTAIVTGEAVLGQGNFTVPGLLVHPGQYIISGVDSQGYNVNGQSEPFTVTANTDPACLAALQFPATATGAEPSPTFLTTASIHTLAPGATGGVTSGTEHHGGMSPGTKAGIAFGAISAVFLLLVGIWYVFVKRRRGEAASNSPVRAYAPGSKSGGAGSGGIGSGDNRAWKGLGSVENHDVAASHYVISDEPKSYRNSGVSSMFDEKPTTYQYPPHDSTPSYPTAAALARTPSGASRASNPYADHHAARSGSSSSSTLNTPTTPTTPSSKQGAAAVSSTKGRKPVPTYDAAEMDHEQEAASATTPGGANPFNSRPSSFSQPSASADTHVDYTESPNPQYALKHQPSFGEKPMQHILIPDMPPPRRVQSPPIHLR